MNLSPLAVQKFFASNGRPLVGGKLFTYVAGTTNKIATYVDVSGGTPNTNPIILDYRGECNIWLDQTKTYKFVLSPSTDTDPPTNPIWTVDYIETWMTYSEIIALITSQFIGALIWPLSTDEVTAGITSTDVNFSYAWGDVRRFKAALDGVTNDTTALQKWASVKGVHSFPAGVSIITATIGLVSDSTYYFSKGSLIQSPTQDISIIAASNATNIQIFGIRVKQTSFGNLASVAGVIFDSCSSCTVDGGEFSDLQWAGVFLNNSNRCQVSNNYFHDFPSTSAGDKSDIVVYRNSSFNTVVGNRCFAGLNADHGIFVQDPGGLGATLPANNKIVENWVGDHKSYGIVFYIGGATQAANNQCISNTVQNITGTGIAGASGSGIYCVGNGLGAQIIAYNFVRNCCISTTSAANGPGGISVNDTLTNTSKIVIVGNVVEEMTQGSGILVSTIQGGAVVQGNVVRIPTSNTGGGAGGATLQGDGIRLNTSSDIDVIGNEVRNLGNGDAFFSVAGTVSVDRINVTGNTFRAAVGNALRMDRLAAFVHTDCVVSANQLRSDSAANLIQLVGVDRVSVTGNNGGANTGAAISVNAATGVRVVGSSMNTNGTNGLVTAGTCTGSNYDSSNRINGNVNNGGTGFRVEITAAATPAAGTYVAGDTVWYLAPAAGAAPGAICTTGGSPGTWKTMAVLAP